MIEKDNKDLSLKRQCALLGVCRSSLYYKPRPKSAEDLALTKVIDQQYLKTPFYGYRRMTVSLQRQGYAVNRKRVRRLMRLMGIEAIYQRPRTSTSHPDHKIYPYLLASTVIERPNQVWATDITYVPMRRGFLYLVALIDWVSRYVLAWRLSNTLETDFCIEALEEAIALFGPPEIHNSDQGSQFTSTAYLEVLLKHGIAISMDGRGRFMDNIFIERLWRSVKYEEIYLHAYESVAEARAGIGAYLHFYNHERPHEALGYQTPKEIFDARPRPGGFVDNPCAFTTTPQAQQQPQLLKNNLKRKENNLWLPSVSLEAIPG
jgi:putative transposase